MADLAGSGGAAVLNAISSARAGLVSDLSRALGMQVSDGWPGRIAAPAVVVVPAPQWVSEGQTFGAEVVAHNDVLIFAGRSTNTAALDQLSELVASVLVASKGDHALEAVDQPGVVSVANTEYLATRIQLAKRVVLA